MSISVEEAMEALRGVKAVIVPDDDYLTLVAAEETIAAAEAKRRKELDELHSNFKALSKTLESARISATRPSAVPSADAHTSTLNELDIASLSLAKSIKETEGSVASKEGELTALKETARTLEDYDPALEHEKELDGTALRLEIYKGLGFEPVPDKHGNIAKMLVRGQSGDIHVVDFNDGRTDLESAQLLWKLACS
ncbi:putative kinetochore protein spc24 [Mycena sanguinolenta]|uniref:Kinetochore protein Spc24 n=1 Tax=Mycena sanguinolenta TaxID=230812 RepID=A0A8H7D8E9_9AGAR|nr:putative kinetochore protein spc24 [Mycena sanguinolenta]